MWVGVRDHNLFIMDAQSPEVAAMGNHICFLPCLPCMEALDSKVHFFFQQFRHTFCPYHRHRGGYVSEFEACAFLSNGFSKKYSFLCIGCVLRNTKYFMQKNEQKYASINPFHMNSQVSLRIHDNGLTLLSGRPTENALQLWPCQSVLTILYPPHQFHHHAPQPDLMREGQLHLT